MLCGNRKITIISLPTVSLFRSHMGAVMVSAVVSTRTRPWEHDGLLVLNARDARGIAASSARSKNVTAAGNGKFHLWRGDLPGSIPDTPILR